MKKQALLYWIPTCFLLLLMAGSGIMYLLQPKAIANAFTQLGYPVYTMYFNATAKILGGIAIALPGFPRFLKEWAYAGYLYIMLLATQAIVMTMPGIPWVMMIALTIWGTSYWQFRKQK